MNTRDIMTDASRKEALGLFLGMLGSPTENRVVIDSLLKEIQDQQNALAAALAESAAHKAEAERLRAIEAQARLVVNTWWQGEQRTGRNQCDDMDTLRWMLMPAPDATPTPKETQP